MKLLLPLLLISLNSFSQKGRTVQTTTIVVAYEISGGYDIYVRNASLDTSVIQVVYNDSTFSVRLGNWEKYAWKGKAPFTLFASNLTHPGEREIVECGSKRDIDKVKISIVTSPAYRTDCRGKVPFIIHETKL